MYLLRRFCDRRLKTSTVPSHLHQSNLCLASARLGQLGSVRLLLRKYAREAVNMQQMMVIVPNIQEFEMSVQTAPSIQ